VVEHGLFLGMASAAILAGPDGIETLSRVSKNKEFPQS
jgi:ribose 5-phosphate isomerase A